MHRIFLTLAIANLSLLMASFVLGLGASGEPRGPGSVWHGTHFLMGLATTIATLMVHSIVYTYFLGTSKWVREVVAAYGMPEWVEVQSRKNKRKARAFVMWGVTSVGVTAWLGAAADAQGYNPLWHLGSATLTLGFSLGAFAAEYAALVAQARLILEVKARADAMRLERYGPDPGSEPTGATSAQVTAPTEGGTA